MKLLLALVISLCASAQAYHILCVFPVPTSSHNILGRGIVDSLLNSGHEVTWVTPYPPKDTKKGLNIIDASDTIQVIKGLDVIASSKLGLAGLSLVKEQSRNYSDLALTPELKATLVNKQFDAVVTEMFFSEFESGYAAVQQVPWIVLSGSVLQPSLLSLVDAANSVPLIPMMFTNYDIPMTFFQRVVTAGMFAGMKLMAWLDTPVNSEQYQKMFADIATARGVELPSYEAALHNISILFVNTHPTLAPSESLPANAVEIGGYHISENIPPLPKDLQNLLDSSPQGVIYFSMGSVMQSASLPEKTRSELLKVFGALPYTVLWKFEEELSGLPKNVHIKKWMPQSSILAHPNVKVFITHGGILSNIEALHHGVPLIAIPLYGDQPANAERAANSGYGIRLQFDADTLAAQLRGALKDMLGTDRYYKQAKNLSSLFTKRPVAPSQLISHYIEVAIQSKGNYHLRSKALLYSWYQRCMLDIAAFVLSILVALCIVFKVVVNAVLGLCKRKESNVKVNEGKGKKKVKKN